MGYFEDNDGNEEDIQSAANNKIFKGTTTLTDITPASPYVISGNDWKMVNFNNKMYFFQG